MKRRDFLRNVASATGAAALLPASSVFDRHAEGGPNPRVDPDQSGIDHVVVVMMENRSFDHVLGWLPGADGRQSGLHYEDLSGQTYWTHTLAPDFTGCGHPDPDHSYQGARIQYAGGTMSGFLKSGNDPFAIGYYVEQDRPFTNALARNYTTLDRSFCSILGPTFPNRVFLHAAQTDRLTNSLTPSTLPTIWDRLASAGVSGDIYYSNVPFLALWGPKYIGVSASYNNFCSTRRRESTVRLVRRSVYTVTDDGRERRDHRTPTSGGATRSWPDVSRGGIRPGMAAHVVHRHVRRVGRLLRPRPAAEGRRRQRCRSRSRARQGAARVPSADHRGLAVDTRTAGQAAGEHRRFRSHVDTQVDRMALGTRAADRS